MSNADALEFERHKQAIKTDGTKASAMAREEAKQYRISKQKERMDQRYEKKLNGAGMVQMMSGSSIWQLGSVMSQFASGRGGANGGSPWKRRKWWWRQWRLPRLCRL